MWEQMNHIQKMLSIIGCFAIVSMIAAVGLWGMKAFLIMLFVYALIGIIGTFIAMVEG